MATPAPTPSKHPGVVLTFGMSIFFALFGFLIYKTYFKPVPKSPAEFSAPTSTCAGAENSFFAPERGITRIKVPLSPTCWTGWVHTPPDWPGWEYISTGPGGLWIQFLNGPSLWIPSGETIPFGVRRGIFRASSSDGELHVRISH